MSKKLTNLSIEEGSTSYILKQIEDLNIDYFYFVHDNDEITKENTICDKDFNQSLVESAIWNIITELENTYDEEKGLFTKNNIRALYNSFPYDPITPSHSIISIRTISRYAVKYSKDILPLLFSSNIEDYMVAYEILMQQSVIELKDLKQLN